MAKELKILMQKDLTSILQFLQLLKMISKEIMFRVYWEEICQFMEFNGILKKLLMNIPLQLR